MARTQNIALHAALDQIARAEGYQAWSHLAAKAQDRPADAILSRLRPGDLILLGARPGQGKTRLGLELALQAPTIGRCGVFFTLDYHDQDIDVRLSELGLADGRDALVTDTSDEISASYVIDRLRQIQGPALVVIDYLQLLDQKRSTPPLDDQVRALSDHAQATGTVFLMISQIDRAFDLSGKAIPDATDIRLPNPIDMSVFAGMAFLNQGRMQWASGPSM